MLHIFGKNVCAHGHPSEFVEAINFVSVVCLSLLPIAILDDEPWLRLANVVEGVADR